MSLSISLRKELSSKILRAKDFLMAQNKLFADQITWAEFAPIFEAVQKRVAGEMIAARDKRIAQLREQTRSLELNELVQAHYETIELRAFIAGVEELASYQAVA